MVLALLFAKKRGPEPILVWLWSGIQFWFGKQENEINGILIKLLTFVFESQNQNGVVFCLETGMPKQIWFWSNCCFWFSKKQKQIGFWLRFWIWFEISQGQFDFGFGAGFVEKEIKIREVFLFVQNDEQQNQFDFGVGQLVWKKPKTENQIDFEFGLAKTKSD